MSDCEVSDTRVPSAFEIEQLLSEVRSFEHAPSLERICNVQQDAKPDKGEPSVLSAEPPNLRFEFPHKSKAAITRTLRVHNLRGHKVKVYFVPPRSQYFTLHGDRVANIYPGMPLRVEVTFQPCEMRSYSDEIRIDSPGETGIVVDLDAKPQCPHAAFPERIDLGRVPLGGRVEQYLVIQPCPDHNVKFSVLRNKWDCDLLVGPLWGVVRPCDEPRRVRILYEPSAYVTALYELLVLVPTASLTPFRVTIAAVCVPALPRDRLLQRLPPVPEPPKKTTKKLGKFTVTTSAARPKLQTPAKMCHPEDHCQLGPYGRPLDQDYAAYLAQCEQFEHAASMLRDDAWRVRVRDEIVRLGSAVAAKGRVSIDKRSSIQQGKLLSEECFKNHDVARFFYQRTMRKSTEDEEKAAASMTPSTGNAEFFVRYQILCKFIAAARRAVTTNRLKKRLQLLKDHAAETIAAEEEAEALANRPKEPEIDVEELKTESDQREGI